MLCKRSLLFSGIFLLSGITFAVCFGGVDAAAADVVYRQMTGEEAYDFYGDSIQATYYSTSGYKNVTLTPSSNRYVYYYSSATTFSENLFPEWGYSSTIPYVSYSAHVTDYSQNPSYLGFDISPNVHFSNCNAIRLCATTYAGASGTSISSSYSESFFDISDGHTLRYTNTPLIKSDGTYSILGLTRGSGNFRTMPVFLDYQSDTLGDVSLLRIGFNGARTDSNYICLYISAPLINDTAVGNSGISSGSSGGSTIINNNVDMTETNSLLDRIKSGISGLGDGLSNLGTSILDGIKSIFVPSEGFMDDQIQEVKDSFAWYKDLEGIGNHFKTAVSQLQDTEAPFVTLNMDGAAIDYSYGADQSMKIQFMDDADFVIEMEKFAPYRPFIRGFLSVLLWVMFLWRLFARLPDIIHGGGMVLADSTKIHNELDNRAAEQAYHETNSAALDIMDFVTPARDIDFYDGDNIDWKV